MKKIVKTLFAINRMIVETVSYYFSTEYEIYTNENVIQILFLSNHWVCKFIDDMNIRIFNLSNFKLIILN